mgnify:CR=1 FL=1
MSDAREQSIGETPPESDVHRTVEAVWRKESARLVAVLVRITRDIGLAEELALARPACPTHRRWPPIT